MIILSGGGDPEAVVPIDAYFASVIDLHKTVLYVPIAMEAMSFSYNECFEWFQRIYSAYGLTHMELCTDLKTLRLDDRYGAVFIGGGNTFKLLHEIQNSDFAIQIRAFLEKGGVLYGGSAGAIVCGKTIEPAAYADENRAGISNYTALNLLNGYDVFCHYDPDSHAPNTNELNRDSYLLFEESGIVFKGETVSSIGKPFLLKKAVFSS